ncbi:MAG: hypothetical protein WB783_07970 [Arenicellales bacterium]
MTVVDRHCGECTLCCKYLGVTAPDGASMWKKPWRTCEFCIGKGCSIHPDRPDPCRKFECLWLQSDLVPEKFRPDRVKAVLTREMGRDGLVVHCLDKDKLRITGGRSDFSRYILRMSRTGPVLLSTDKDDTHIGNNAARLNESEGNKLGCHRFPPVRRP